MYVPEYEPTPNFVAGMTAMSHGQLQRALALLSSEPIESTCFSLARANMAMALDRLGRYQEAEVAARRAIAVMTRDGCPHPPTVIQTGRILAEALSSQGRRVESFDWFNTAANLSDELAAEYPTYADELEIQKGHLLNSWGGAQLHVRRYAAAEEILQAARDIYKKHAALHPPGRAATLTNLAHAYRRTGQETKAEYALVEAREIARQEQDEDEEMRILIALGQLGSERFDRVNDMQRVLASADRDSARKRYATAYIRRCICAQLVLQWGDTATGLNIVRSALGIEEHLDETDLNPARIRLTQANLMQQGGAARREVVSVLIQGASLWFTRIGGPLIRNDFAAITAEMHDHFRLLSRILVDCGRTEEAALSFEAGRALAHSIEIDRRSLERVIHANPFARDGSAIDLTALRRIQGTLATNTTCVSIAVLPPDLVAFIVDGGQVTSVTVPMPTEQEQLKALFAQIKVIPSRLEVRDGHGAIPQPVADLGSAIATAIGTRHVQAIAPYGSLHQVPWRAVLRHAGLTWLQLACRNEFGFLLRDGAAPAPLPTECVALGAGTAMGIDLGDEARGFAERFATSSIIVPCTRRDLELALQRDAVVLVSCHGIARDVTRQWAGLADGELVLELSDGKHAAKDVIPTSVKAPLVILSACESGVYQMSRADFPVGAAPDLIRAGSKNCIGARFKLDARFAARFFQILGQQLASGNAVESAVAFACADAEADGADLWRDIGCLELIGGT